MNFTDSYRIKRHNDPIWNYLLGSLRVRTLWVAACTASDKHREDWDGDVMLELVAQKFKVKIVASIGQWRYGIISNTDVFVMPGGMPYTPNDEKVTYPKPKK